MTWGELPAIRSGRTKVEVAKGITHPQSTRVNELFGDGSWANRLLPTPVIIPAHLEAEILGYVMLRSRCSNDGGEGTDCEEDKAAQRRHAGGTRRSSRFSAALGVAISWGWLPVLVICCNVTLGCFLGDDGGLAWQGKMLSL